MKTLKFKKGEWCFYDFELCQVTQTEENRITEVSSGVICYRGFDLSEECYPLEMSVKQISDSVAYLENEFSSLKNRSVNHMDLHRELLRRWIELCKNRNDEDHLTVLQNRLQEFGLSFLQKVHELDYEMVDGIRLSR